MVPVTRDNVAVLFLDLQDEIVKYSRTVPPERLQRTAAALAKLAALQTLPCFFSGVASGGSYLSALLAPLGRPEIRMRTATTAFADRGLVEALRGSERSTVVLCGVATEIVVQHTALDALAAGYTVHVAADACGGVDSRSEEAAWRRIVAAGGVTTSVTALAGELTGDFSTEAGGATLAILYETIGG
jgi:hypothetical protein